MHELLQRKDPVANWADIVKAGGLHSGDVADALAAYRTLNWMMANGRENSRAEVLAVRKQVQQALGSDVRFVRLSNSERQQLAEKFMLHFLLQQAAYVDAIKRGDKMMIRRLSDAAVTRFQNEMNLNLRQIKVTKAGFH